MCTNTYTHHCRDEGGNGKGREKGKEREGGGEGEGVFGGRGGILGHLLRVARAQAALGVYHLSGERQKYRFWQLFL